MLTWLAHSSLAIILFIMSLAAGGAIDPALGLALVLGANIGGAIAPYVALSGSSVPPAACRSAISSARAGSA